MNKLYRPDGESTKRVIRDAATGSLLELRGVDFMKSAGLVLRREIDLTRPIAEQVMKRHSLTRRKHDESD